MTDTARECIAVFDVGTTSVKISLLSRKMEFLCVETREYSLHAWENRVEAEAEQYLSAIRSGLHTALEKTGSPAVLAVSLTTQGETLTAADQEGNALRPFIVWLDQRAERQADALKEMISSVEFYRETGLPEIGGALPLAKILWLKENEPHIYQAAHKILLLEDYLLFQFTGKFVSEKSLLTSTGYFSLKKDDYWTEMLETAGIDVALLPPAIEPGTQAGILRPEAARLLGLKAGIPVIAGAMDQTAAALAAESLFPGAVAETTGTALVAAAGTDSPIFPEDHPVTIYRHVKKGRFLYLPIGNTGGMALRWFRDEFCRDLPGGYEALNGMAEKIPPGCDGVTFLPFLSGNVDPDACPEASAVFFGLRLSSTRAHAVRSVMEAVAFMLKDFLEMLDKLGCMPKTICSFGGGARSPLWEQIKADVCQCDFLIPACAEAASLGAALLAAWKIGVLPEGKYPIQTESRLFSPNPEAREAYQKAYCRYQHLYQAVKPLY